MLVRSLTLRDFRSYERATALCGSGLTVIWGPNGAGKTNLLEGLYVGCTGRSCRTNADRELLRFGTRGMRVEVTTEHAGVRHELAVGVAAGEAKRMTVDGAAVERLLDSPARPLVSVFLPDRLELIKGVPAGRRAHLDQYVAALWPARALTRRRYAQALAQRNALLARMRNGVGGASLEAWDEQLAQAALALMADRAAAVATLIEPFARIAGALGLDGDPTLRYRPRSVAETPAAFVAELQGSLDTDLARGFTGHGPHRDDVQLLRAGRDLRTYGSQGQQRIGLLALLLAEREAIAARRDQVPLMLLDDVLSELDGRRRAALIAVLAEAGGQTVLTTTDREHVPDRADTARLEIEVDAGRLHAGVDSLSGAVHNAEVF